MGQLSEHVLEILEMMNEVENTSKTKEKEKLMEAYKEDHELKRMLDYTLNPFKVYGIKKIDGIDMDTPSNREVEISWESFFTLLDQLDVRIISGNAAIEKARDIIEGSDLRIRKWLLRILFRELQSGVQISTVNKVFGKYIRQYNVLLASKDLKKVEFPCYEEPKSDGMRCGVYMYPEGQVVLRTRNGKMFTGFDDIEARAREVFSEGFMYDGELLGIDGNFKGIQKLAMKDAEDKKGLFSVYDRVPISFMEDDSREVYRIGFSKRRKALTRLGLSKKKGIIRLGESYLVRSMDEAQEMYQGFVDRGFEGAMFKMKDMLYEKNTTSKRCKKMIKLKPEETIDLRVIDFVEERDVNGTPKGTLGALIIEYKGCKVRVGSGLKDKFKDEVWADIESYRDKIAEIVYDCETSNEKGGVSLRFPRFITMREDKSEADN